MGDQYPHQPEITNLYDDPTDEELKRIKEELDFLN